SAENETEITILLVNTSPEKTPHFKDTNLYEASIEVLGLSVRPYILESLPDSFRYDRRIYAYGINCGVELVDDAQLRTTDVICVDKYRPIYWSAEEPQPDFTFATLSANPLPSLIQLTDSHSKWGEQAWGRKTLEARAKRDGWSPGMLVEAETAAHEFW